MPQGRQGHPRLDRGPGRIRRASAVRCSCRRRRPAPAVDAHALALGHPTDRAPPRQAPCRRERRGQRVVVAAGQHPRQRVHVQRGAAPRAAGRAPRTAPTSSVDRTPLASAMWPRSATSPSLTSSSRWRRASAARGPCAYGGSGRRCAATTCTRRAEAAAEHREAGRGPAQPAGHRHDVAGPRTGRGHRLAALRSPSAVTASMTRSRGRHVAADDRRAHRAALLAQPVGQPVRPLDGQVAPAPPGRPAARSDGRPSRRCRRGSAPPPCARRPSAARPVPTEVPALDQQVGRGHDPAVGRGHDARRRRPARAACSRPERTRRVTRARSRPNSPSSPTVMRSCSLPSVGCCDTSCRRQRRA